jgi:hypothetical protein
VNILTERPRPTDRDHRLPGRVVNLAAAPPGWGAAHITGPARARSSEQYRPQPWPRCQQTRGVRRRPVLRGGTRLPAGDLTEFDLPRRTVSDESSPAARKAQADATTAPCDHRWRAWPTPSTRCAGPGPPGNPATMSLTSPHQWHAGEATRIAGHAPRRHCSLAQQPGRGWSILRPADTIGPPVDSLRPPRPPAPIWPEHGNVPDRGTTAGRRRPRTGERLPPGAPRQ